MSSSPPSKGGRLFVVGYIGGVVCGTIIGMSMVQPKTSGSTSVGKDSKVEIPSAPAKAESNVSTGSSSPERSSNAYVSPLLAYFGVHGDRFYEQILRAPSPAIRGGLVVEVGSHSGLQASFARELGYQCVVMEPSPSSFTKVTTLKAAKGFDNDSFEVLQIAASSAKGNATFFTVAGGSTEDHITLTGEVHKGEERHFTVPGKSGHKVIVPTSPIDDVIGDRRVFFLKVDTQGHELHVLRGAEKLFTEKRVSFAMFEFWPDKIGFSEAHKILELLDKWGYDTYFLHQHKWVDGILRSPDSWLQSPPNPKAFVKAINDSHIPGQFGIWTDIAVVCRGCVNDNMRNKSDPWQGGPQK